MGLIVGQRHIRDIFDCRACRRASDALLFAVEGGASAVAVDVYFEDGGVVDDAVDSGERHRGVGEDTAPFTEPHIGSDQDGAAFVARADQFEQHRCFRLILGDIGQVVKNQKMVAIEAGDCSLQCQFAPRDLEFLHQVGCAREQHAPAIFHQSEADLAASLDAELAAGGVPDLAILRARFAPDPANLPDIVVPLTPLVAYDALLDNSFSKSISLHAGQAA